MSMTLDLPAARRIGPLSLPSPSPPVMSASNSRSVSRSSSYGGQDSKRLVFLGQRVNVILPEKIPDVPEGIDDIQVRLNKIHDVNKNEVGLVLGKVLMVG